MSTLDEATQPRDTSKMTAVQDSRSSGPPPESADPGMSPFLRTPLPPINATPDTLRQFYGRGVPQNRVIPPPPPTSLGVQGEKGDPGTPAPAAPAPIVKSPPPFGLKRETVGFVTESLAPGAQAKGTVKLGKTFNLLSVALYTGPARIRLYSTTAFRDADLSRPVNVPPVNGTEHGCIFDLMINDPTLVFSDWESWSIGASTSVDTEWVTYAPYVDIDHIDHYHDFGKFIKGGWYRLAIEQGAPDHWEDSGTKWVLGPTIGIQVETPEHGILTIKADPGNYGWAGEPPIHSDAFQIPVDASKVDVRLSQPDPLHPGGVHYHFDFANHNAPAYPISWVCSPEAIGSDAEGPPTGDIAYTVDNLGSVTTQIIYGLLIIKDEK